jgi:hypothetical protein
MEELKKTTKIPVHYSRQTRLLCIYCFILVLGVTGCPKGFRGFLPFVHVNAGKIL